MKCQSIYNEKKNETRRVDLSMWQISWWFTYGKVYWKRVKTLCQKHKATRPSSKQECKNGSSLQFPAIDVI